MVLKTTLRGGVAESLEASEEKVEGHVAQVTDDAAHLLQVLVHLIFPGIPPLMAICSRSSTTRAGWLATTPSWLFPQALLAPLFILTAGSDGNEDEEGQLLNTSLYMRIQCESTSQQALMPLSDMLTYM
ncbi:hypothetical protein INR49_004395 [Caranx melampygus]|nr:hypothetical protein INR49_004395 [Caranx melampygus]